MAAGRVCLPYRIALLVAAIAVSAALMGCSAKVPPGYVMREWSKTIREEGIVPTFPPREDVRVGDLYVYDYDPDSAEAEERLERGDRKIGMTPRWDSLDLLSTIEDSYRLRPSMPVTPDEYSGMLKATDAKVWHQPSATGPLFQSAADGPNRLQLVAFPDFSATTFSKGDLSTLIPIQALAVLFRAGWTNTKSVTVKIPSAESYGVSTNDALDKLLELEADGTWTIRSAYGDRLKVYISSGNEAWMRVNTEVYYARVLDIMIKSTRTQGFRAETKDPTGTTGATGATADNTGSIPDSDAVPDSAGARSSEPTPSGASGPTPASDLTPAVRAAALQQELMAAGSSVVPGGAFQFVSASDTEVSMRRVYYRPVAVGWRGVTVRFNPKTGTVDSIAPSSGAHPQAQEFAASRNEVSGGRR